MILSFGTKGAFNLSKTSGGLPGLVSVCTRSWQSAAGAWAAHSPLPVLESRMGTQPRPCVGIVCGCFLSTQAELSSSDGNHTVQED